MSPAVFRLQGIKFHFFANEGTPREPIHIHASRPGGGQAKIWLYPDVSIAWTSGYTRREEAMLLAAVKQHRVQIEGAWNEFFGKGSQV